MKHNIYTHWLGFLYRSFLNCDHEGIFALNFLYERRLDEAIEKERVLKESYPLVDEEYSYNFFVYMGRMRLTSSKDINEIKACARREIIRLDAQNPQGYDKYLIEMIWLICSACLEKLEMQESVFFDAWDNMPKGYQPELYEFDKWLARIKQEAIADHIKEDEESAESDDAFWEEADKVFFDEEGSEAWRQKRIEEFSFLHNNYSDPEIKRALQVLIDAFDVEKRISSDDEEKAKEFIESRGIQIYETGNEIRSKEWALEEAQKAGTTGVISLFPNKDKS